MTTPDCTCGHAEDVHTGDGCLRCSCLDYCPASEPDPDGDGTFDDGDAPPAMEFD